MHALLTLTSKCCSCKCCKESTHADFKQSLWARSSEAISVLFQHDLMLRKTSSVNACEITALKSNIWVSDWESDWTPQPKWNGCTSQCANFQEEYLYREAYMPTVITVNTPETPASSSAFQQPPETLPWPNVRDCVHSYQQSRHIFHLGVERGRYHQKNKVPHINIQKGS
jgi:hypothetical protein